MAEKDDKKSKSMITPFEAVGVIAAQSIGEPGTQMSLANNEKIIVIKDDSLIAIEIGKFADELIALREIKKINESEVCDVSELDYFVPSLDENGEIKIKKLLEVSKHKFNGKLLEIKTESGKQIIATPNHSFVIRKNGKIIPMRGSELKMGEKLPVLNDAQLNVIKNFVNIGEVKNSGGTLQLINWQTLLAGECAWDEIIEIKEYSPENKLVYDFSVEGLETFATFDGIITHNTMRTFHYAGVAEHVPTGLPRLIELVDAKKAPKKPLIDIYLKSAYRSESEAEKVARDVSSIFVRDVARVEDDLAEKTITITYSEKDGKALNVSFAALKKAIEEHSPDIRVNESKILLKPKREKKKEEDKEKEITSKYVRKLANKIKASIVKGIHGVNRAVVVRGEGEYFIRAAGSNILGAVTHEAVDPKRVYTNNIKEIERVYGIEAARNAIIKEINDVMEMQKLYVDIRHIMLVSDAMTFDGVVKSISRHGLSGQKVGVLGRAAFEETIKHLIEASSFAEDENLIGVTENIIVGQTVPVGTGKIRLTIKARRKAKS